MAQLVTAHPYRSSRQCMAPSVTRLCRCWFSGRQKEAAWSWSHQVSTLMRAFVDGRVEFVWQRRPPDSWEEC